MEFNSIPFIFFINSIHFLHDSFTSLCSYPLFSSIVTLYILILLYTPSLFLSVAFSPIFNSTGILLLSLLRLGADERSKKEFGSLESRILDFVEHNQTEVESEPKIVLGLELDQTHVEFEPKTGLDLELNQTLVEFKSKTDLDSKSDQTHVNSELEIRLGPGSNQVHMELESKTGLGSKSNQTHVDFESKTDLNSIFHQTFVNSEPKIGLSSESNQVHSNSKPKIGLGSESNQTHVDFESKTDLNSKSCQTHVNSEPNINLGFEFHTIGSESNQTHADSEPKTVVGSESISEDDYHKWELLETVSMESPQVVAEEDPLTKTDPEQVDTSGSSHGSGSIQFFDDLFLEWNMRAPLEIIYEAYEGEEEGEEEEEEEDDDEKQESNGNDDVSGEKRVVGPERYPSLSMYYPESDTDSSSDGEFPVIGNWETQESVFFKWKQEEREELIEISLDRYGKKSIEFCHVEEDNLIEIDIFPARS